MKILLVMITSCLLWQGLAAMDHFPQIKPWELSNYSPFPCSAAITIPNPSACAQISEKKGSPSQLIMGSRGRNNTVSSCPGPGKMTEPKPLPRCNSESGLLPSEERRVERIRRLSEKANKIKNGETVNDPFYTAIRVAMLGDHGALKALFLTHDCLDDAVDHAVGGILIDTLRSPWEWSFGWNDTKVGPEDNLWRIILPLLSRLKVETKQLINPSTGMNALGMISNFPKGYFDAHIPCWQFIIKDLLTSGVSIEQMSGVCATTIAAKKGHKWLVELLLPYMVDNVPECTICHKSFIGGAIQLLQCSHYFHQDCLEVWRQHKTTCPDCCASI